MKRIMAMLLSMTMVFGLCACDEKEDSSSKKEQNSSSITESSEESSSEVESSEESSETEESSDSEDSSEVTTSAPDNSNDDSEEYTTTKFPVDPLTDADYDKYIDVVKPVSLNQVLYDDNNIKITLTGYQTNEDTVDNDGDYLLRLNCDVENKSDKKLYITAENIKVNNTPIHFSDIKPIGTIEAGANVPDFYGISSGLLLDPYNINFGDVKKVQFDLVIQDSDTMDTLYTQEGVTINLK